MDSADPSSIGSRRCAVVEGAAGEGGGTACRPVWEGAGDREGRRAAGRVARAPPLPAAQALPSAASGGEEGGGQREQERRHSLGGGDRMEREREGREKKSMTCGVHRCWLVWSRSDGDK
jgi:hypothetical protein